MSKINIPLNFNVKGTIKSIKLIDTRNGNLDYEQKNIKNLNLYQYLNNFFESQRSFLLRTDPDDSVNHYGPMLNCFIGSDDTPPSRSDDGLYNEMASTSYENKSVSAIGDNPQYAETTYTFPAGVGTGTIKEIGIGNTEGFPSYYTSRKVLSSPIIKEDYHELQIIWKLEVELPANQTFSGVIQGGQKDGSTDINWEISINNKQFYRICKGLGCDGGGSSWYIKNNPFYHFLNDNYFYIKTGDSNLSADLVNDSEYTIKGNGLFSGDCPLITNYDYVANSLERKTRIGFDVGNSNGQIGEILICSSGISNQDINSTGIFRITFDPKLDKTSDFRLYLDITISLNPS